jgi:hypothetical protein
MDTRSSSPTGTNGCARHVDSGRILPKGSRLSRRKFGEFFGMAVTVVTGSLGGLVGYVPRAYAAPPTPRPCDFDYEPLRGCQCYPGQPTCTCIGLCSEAESQCPWGPRPDEDYCIVYNFFPGIHPGARAVGSCIAGSGAGYCCGVYC